MNKKSVLTSLTAIMVAAPAIVTGVVSPAMATTWPGTDVMSKNTTYDSAATLAHMGVSENGAEAQAQAYYNINSGYYLPVDSYVARICPVNNYCSGVNNVTKNTSIAQGIDTCNNGTNSGYGSSVEGANAVYDCYTTCPTPVATDHLAEANGVIGWTSGQLYYGALNNCVPSACAAGFDSAVIDAVAKYGDKTSNIYGYVNDSGGFSASNSSVDSVSFGLTTGDSWGVDFASDGKLFGGSACKVAGNAIPSSGVGSLATGTTCYCWLTGYKPTTGLETRRSMKSLAVPVYDLSSYCSANCPHVCAAFVANAPDSSVIAAAAGVSIDSSVVSAAKSLIYEHASNDQKCVNSYYNLQYACGEGTGGTVPSSQIVEYLTSYTPAANTCTKNGYSFSGWGVSGEASTVTVDAGVLVSGTGESGGYPYTTGKTYTAKWDSNEYTITLSNTTNGGGPANYDIKEVYATKWTNASGTTITNVDRPTKNASVFLGYYNDAAGTTQMIPASGELPSGATKFDDTNTVNKATTVYAKFAECNCAAGVGVSSCSYNSVNSNACVYDVVCSYNSETAYYGYASQMGDAAVASYTAECSPCSNKPKTNAHYTGAVTAVAPAVPTNTCQWACDAGHSLTGKKAGTMTGTDNQSTVDCTAIDDYLVTYKNVPSTLEGGSCTGATYNSNTGDWTKNYTYGQGLALCAPTKLGYSFSGWASDSTCGTPQKPVTLSATDLGDKTYHACWSQNTINIIWGGIYSNSAARMALADGSNMSDFNESDHTAKSSVLYDDNIATPVSPINTADNPGQVFIGWKFLKTNPNSGS